MTSLATRSLPRRCRSHGRGPLFTQRKVGKPGQLSYRLGNPATLGVRLFLFRGSRQVWTTGLLLRKSCNLGHCHLVVSWSGKQGDKGVLLSKLSNHGGSGGPGGGSPRLPLGRFIG